MTRKIMVDAIDGSAELASAGQTVEIYHIPSKSSVIFKAMMTQFEDAFTSNWTSEQAYGRMDPLQTYQNTSRVISMGFDVAAASAKEAEINLQKVSSLAQFLYPTYDADGLISSSPFCRIQFMNWSTETKGNSPVVGLASQTGLMGTINGFTFAPNLDLGVFPESDYDLLLPKLLNVSFTFTVLHNHSLGWIKSQEGVVPREQCFPYAQPIRSVGEAHPDDNAGFQSVLSKIQTTEVPIDARAEAIKQDLLRDTEKWQDNPQLSYQEVNRMRRNRIRTEVRQRTGLRGASTLAGGGKTFFSKG